MKKSCFSLLTFFLFLLNPSVTVLAQTPKNTPSPSAIPTNPDTIRQIAQGITVKILVADTNSSGVIIAKNGTTYTVITNAHVVTRGSSYRIQTPDGKTYQATLKHQGASLEGNDLAVLEFRSESNYRIATIGDSATIEENDTVFSAGFPIEGNKLTLISGKITLISPKPLKGGYQIAYSNETQQGMSGGALLDADGKLIGIIGMDKGAVLEEAYTYLDNTRPTRENIRQWREYSFAVPVASLRQVSPQIAQSPQNPQKLNAQYIGIVKQVDDIAQQITVRIDYQENNQPVNGSGVIVGKQGKTYYVLTAAHVVENFNQHKVITPDGQIYPLFPQQITILNKDIDVALVTFTSDKTYQVAELGNYSLKDAQWVFVSGFPAKNSNKQRILTAGKVRDKERASFVSKDAFSLSNGQELVYTSFSLPGMSGGAILDTQGKVIGINTGSENEYLTSSEKGYQEVSLGYSLGVPISTFLGLSNQGKVLDKSLSVSQTVPNKISSTEQASIKAQLFNLQPPANISNALDWLDYGNQLWRSFQYSEAVVAFERAINLLEKSEKNDILALAYYGEGLAFWAEKKWPEALSAFQQATLHDARFYQAWRYQGMVLGYGMKQYPEALVAYEKAIQYSRKQNFVLYVEMGDILRELKRYSEAFNSYNQAITLKKDHSWAYLNRGILYYEQKKWDLAFSDYTKAIQLAPNDAVAYGNRGLVYDKQQKWDLALTDYTKAIQLDSNDAVAYANRGTLYVQQQKLNLALMDYTKAIQLDSNLVEAYVNRGIIRAQIKDNQGAIEDLQKAAQLFQAQGNMAAYQQVMEGLRLLGN